MKLIVYLLLFSLTSCRVKTVESTRTSIDSTFWYATAKRLTLADIQDMIDLRITVTDLDLDSMGVALAKPKKVTRYDIQGEVLTMVDETIAEDIGNSVVTTENEARKEETEQTTSRPKKPPSMWWVVLVVIVILLYKR